MLSKNQSKLITSLKQKKYRIQHNMFVAEGVKVVKELLNSSIELVNLYCTEEIEGFTSYNPTIISDRELSKISNLKTPNKVLGVFKIPNQNSYKDNGLVLVLDAIKDPGNLGTLIRLCDLFGIEQLVCSNETVDCYNAKVVQATMGSLTRVSIMYEDLIPFFKNTSLPVYGALLDGENIYESKLPINAILVIGNESNGISRAIIDVITNKITIPRFGDLQQTESLNAATATAILLSEFKR